MKIGYIAEPNSKGQIVIPKKIRDELNITEDTSLNIFIRGGGIYLYPFEDVVTNEESGVSYKSYLEILKKTKGILAGKPYYKNEKAKKKLELDAAKSRRKAWW